MSIGETLTHTARHNGAGLALAVGSRHVDWRALNEGANRFANALLKLGAAPGDRVVMFLENSVEFVEVYYGLAIFGAWRGNTKPLWSPSNSIAAGVDRLDLRPIAPWQRPIRR